MPVNHSVSSRRYFSPGEVAEQLEIDIRKVLAWVRSGELRAVNVATRVNGRKPRWRIFSADLEAFLSRRSATPAPAAPRRRRKDASVVEFF